MDVEDSDSGKDEVFPKERERKPTGTGKGKGAAKDGKDGANNQDERTHQQSKVSAGKTRHQFEDCWTLADGHSNRVKDSEILLEREMM